MGLGPDTETTQTEPADVTQFRTQTIQPFLEGIFRQPTSPQGNPFAQMAAQQPEQQVLQSQFDALSGLSQGGGLGAAQQVIGAAQPVFNHNLQQAGAEFMSQAPSTFNTSAGAGLGNLQARALQDFNLFAGQALQQGQQTGIDAAQTLGGLGQAAGGAQQRFINPTLQLMLGGMGMAQPMPADVASQPGLFGQLLGAAGSIGGGMAAGGTGFFG